MWTMFSSPSGLLKAHEREELARAVVVDGDEAPMIAPSPAPERVEVGKGRGRRGRRRQIQMARTRCTSQGASRLAELFAAGSQRDGIMMTLRCSARSAVGSAARRPGGAPSSRESGPARASLALRIEVSASSAFRLRCCCPTGWPGRSRYCTRSAGAVAPAEVVGVVSERGASSPLVTAARHP